MCNWLHPRKINRKVYSMIINLLPLLFFHCSEPDLDEAGEEILTFTNCKQNATDENIYRFVLR